MAGAPSGGRAAARPVRGRPVGPAAAGESSEMSLEEIQEDLEGGDPDDWRFLRCLMPAAVVAAFDEALDLYRAVEGHESSIAGFAEALVADAMAGPSGSDIE